MIRLAIESPLSPRGGYSFEENLEFAQRACRYALSLGYAPFASHLLYTMPFLLRDHIPRERELGMQAGFAWSLEATEAWFCLREGEKALSHGMSEAFLLFRDVGLPCKGKFFTPLGIFVHDFEIGDMLP